MKSICSILAVVCLALVGIAGCTDDATKTDTSDVVAPPQTTVIRYTADDIKALPAGEFLQVNLNDTDTVYSITYDNPSDLDRVLITRGLEQYILSQKLPASAGPGASKHIILGAGDSTSDIAKAAADPNFVVSCRCPCCISVGDITVCCI